HTAPPVAYSRAAHPPHLPSSPTRRSSDLPSPGHTPHHPHPEPVPSPPRRRNESEGTDGRNTGTHAGRRAPHPHRRGHPPAPPKRSEEHTSELQSRENLVCRLLLEKKKTHN